MDDLTIAKPGDKDKGVENIDAWSTPEPETGKNLSIDIELFRKDTMVPIETLAFFGNMMIDYAGALMHKKHVPEVVREARLAAKQLVESVEETNRDETDGMTWLGEPETLAQMGKISHSLSFAKNPDIADIDVLGYLLDDAKERGNSLMSAALMLPPFQLRACWSARWYDHAMPRVVWETQAYAEQLMVSKARAEVLDDVRPPWAAFLIDLPRNLLYSKHPRTGENSKLVHVLVHAYPNDEGTLIWNFMAQGPSGVELWRHGLTTQQLVDPDSRFFTDLYEGSIANEDELTLQYIGNLIVGTCLSISDKSKVREAKHSKAKKAKRGGEKGKAPRRPPPTRNYVVGTPVQVRVREAIKDSYEAVNSKKKGKTCAVKLATFVRGFWRKQAYGPRHSLRRPVHVEGYWRNLDKDVPIVVRPHKVEKDDE